MRLPCLRGAIVSIFLLLLSVAASRGALPSDARTRDFVVDFSATVSDTSPCIVLSWTLTQHLQSYISVQMIYRRLKGEEVWVKLADLTKTTVSYADTTAVPGVEYEYWMRRDFTNLGYVPVGSAPAASNAMGYISAGVKVPEVHSRGKLLLLVDDTMAAPLAPEIAQLKDDLAGDGWTVEQINAPRTGTPTSTKALIKAAYNADPANTKALYILGHVPVPYSGNLHPPDGHTNVSGAWVADGYYGEMNGTWTDTTVNTNNSPDTKNVPGDGRFDQSYWPSPLELEVGRVDMWALYKAPSTAVSETALLRRYLRRAHDFRYKQGEYANIRRRTLMLDSGVLLGGGEPITINFWSTAFNSVPEPPAAPVIDEPAYGQWFTNAGPNSYLMGEAFGGGEYEGGSSVGTSTDFGSKANRVVFMAEMASNFGNWNGPNNLMRSIIAGNADGTNLALTCFWVGRPNYFLHHLGMGGTIGYSTRLSQNSSFSTYGNYYSPAGNFRGYVHLSLLGDPALRLHIVEPPRGLSAKSAGGQVTLDWADSTEPRVQGYHVYRATTSAGPFTRLTPTPVATSDFTDATAAEGQTYTYMVRTQKLEYAPGGSYNNLSNGVMATLSANSGGTSAPGNPSNLTVTPGSGVLAWTDNSNNETGFRIERKVNVGGTYATLATLAANTTGHADPGPFANGNVYYYRVIATGPGGDSIASNETSFDAVAGYFQIAAPKLKVSKTAGTAQISLERFGGSAGAVTLSYSTTNASAIAGTHFTAPGGTLTWADGEIGAKIISVPITNTATPQQPRQFTISLTSATGGAGIGEYRNIAVVIEDPTATLPSPWSENVGSEVSDYSPAVEAEGVLGSASMGGRSLFYPDAVDAGHFIYQSRTGDGILTAYVPAPAPVQSGACFAVMVRDSLNGGSPMAATVLTGSANIGTQFMYRTSGYAASVIAGINTAQQAPCWVKITRAGNTFTSESSADGVNWTTRGTASVPLASTALWGVFHVSQILNGSTGYGDFQLATFQNVSFGSVPVPPAPGSFALTTPTSTSVNLTWTASPFAAGYRIERRTETSGFTLLADIPSGLTLAYTDSTVSASSAYQYRVLAYNGTGASAFAPVLGAATADGNPLQRPGFFTLTPGTGSWIDLAWTDNSGNEANFQIERRAANGAWTLVQTLAANATSYTDTTTLPGVIYEYRVRAAGAAGISSWATTASGIQHSSATTVNCPIWSPDSVVFQQMDAPPGSAYVPTGFHYYPDAIPLVTSQRFGGLRTSSGANAWAGMKITVGANPITIFGLGRWVIAGNTATHTIKIVDFATGLDVPGASVTVACAGAPAGYKYTATVAPVTLEANKAYWIMSQDPTGADDYYDGNSDFGWPAGVAVGNGSAFSTGVGTYTLSGYGANSCYGALDFKYTITPVSPFTTGNGMATVRNDRSGWLGMKITTGASNLLVTQLGRWVAPGNTGTHVVKIVNAATGADLASATVSTLGAPAGQMKNAPLAATATLEANSSYYILSQETEGGDTWYDYSFLAAGTATGYQSWLLTNGLPMDESGSGSPAATPAGDGLANLVKYALGLAPGVAGSSGRLSYDLATDAGHKYLGFTYARPEPAPNGIVYGVEASADLVEWNAAGVVEINSTLNAGLRTITVRDGAPLSGAAKRFMRLHVTQP